MTPAEIRARLDHEQAVVCTLYGESRSEPLDGQLAVASVIRNRVRADLGHDGKPDWWGEGFRQVCLQRKQFTCWNEDGSANSAKTHALAESLLLGFPAFDVGLVDTLRWIAFPAQWDPKLGIHVT